MPIYTFENTKTGKVFDDMMSISEKESYLKKNKHIKQVVTLTVGVYLLFIVACGLCRSLEGFDNQEKSIEYYTISEYVL